MFAISKHLVLVRIDKKAQDLKRSTVGKGLLYSHSSFVFMDRNLQYGEVLQVGAIAKANYPDIEVGDTIFFHHTIEDGSDRLIDKDESGNPMLYILGNDKNASFEIYGTLKRETGEIIPSKHYLWLFPDVKRLKRELSSSLIHIDESAETAEDEAHLRWKLDELEEDKKDIERSMTARRTGYTIDQEYDRRVEVVNAIEDIDRQRHQINMQISRSKKGIARVAFVNKETSQRHPKVQQGVPVIVDLPLYPLDIFNPKNPANSRMFNIVRVDAIIGYEDLSS